MEYIAIKDLLYIGGIILSAVVTFVSTKYRLQEMIRDKHDENTKAVHELRLEIERLRSRDDLQQTTIDQLKNHLMDSLKLLYTNTNKQ